MKNLFDAILLESIFAKFCATYGAGVYEGMHADLMFRLDFIERTRRIVKK